MFLFAPCEPVAKNPRYCSQGIWVGIRTDGTPGAIEADVHTTFPEDEELVLDRPRLQEALLERVGTYRDPGYALRLLQLSASVALGRIDP